MQSPICLSRLINSQLQATFSAILMFRQHLIGQQLSPVHRCPSIKSCRTDRTSFLYQHGKYIIDTLKGKVFFLSNGLCFPLNIGNCCEQLFYFYGQLWWLLLNTIKANFWSLKYTSSTLYKQHRWWKYTWRAHTS